MSTPDEQIESMLDRSGRGFTALLVGYIALAGPLLGSLL